MRLGIYGPEMHFMQGNRKKYGNRNDKKEGLQAEFDLDILDNNLPLTETYKDNLNNWEMISSCLQ